MLSCFVGLWAIGGAPPTRCLLFYPSGPTVFFPGPSELPATGIGHLSLRAADTGQVLASIELPVRNGMPARRTLGNGISLPGFEYSWEEPAGPPLPVPVAVPQGLYDVVWQINGTETLQGRMVTDGTLQQLVLHGAAGVEVVPLYDWHTSVDAVGLPPGRGLLCIGFSRYSRLAYPCVPRDERPGAAGDPAPRGTRRELVWIVRDAALPNHVLWRSRVRFSVSADSGDAPASYGTWRYPEAASIPLRLAHDYEFALSAGDQILWRQPLRATAETPQLFVGNYHGYLLFPESGRVMRALEGVHFTEALFFGVSRGEPARRLAVLRPVYEHYYRMSAVEGAGWNPVYRLLRAQLRDRLQRLLLRPRDFSFLPDAAAIVREMQTLPDHQDWESLFPTLFARDADGRLALGQALTSLVISYDPYTRVGDRILYVQSPVVLHEGTRVPARYSTDGMPLLYEVPAVAGPALQLQYQLRIRDRKAAGERGNAAAVTTQNHLLPLNLPPTGGRTQYVRLQLNPDAPEELLAELRELGPLQVSAGVLCRHVTPDGKGAEAGLRTGDVIIAYGGHRMTNVADLGREIRRRAAAGGEEQVTVRLVRDLRAMTLRVPPTRLSIQIAEGKAIVADDED